MGNRNEHGRKREPEVKPDQVEHDPDDDTAEDLQASFMSCDDLTSIEGSNNTTCQPCEPAVGRARSGSMADKLLDQLPSIVKEATLSEFNRVEVSTRPGNARREPPSAACQSSPPAVLGRGFSDTNIRGGGRVWQGQRQAPSVCLWLRAGAALNRFTPRST